MSVLKSALKVNILNPAAQLESCLQHLNLFISSILRCTALFSSFNQSCTSPLAPGVLGVYFIPNRRKAFCLLPAVRQLSDHSSSRIEQILEYFYESIFKSLIFTLMQTLMFSSLIYIYCFFCCFFFTSTPPLFYYAFFFLYHFLLWIWNPIWNISLFFLSHSHTRTKCPQVWLCPGGEGDRWQESDGCAPDRGRMLETPCRMEEELRWMCMLLLYRFKNINL